MEEILVVALQGLVEFLLELRFYIGVDLRWKRDDGAVGCGYVLVFLLLGAGLGALMNVIHPRLLLPTPELQMAALIIGPLAAGGASWWVARYRKEHGADVEPGKHFITALCFVLAFDVVRYAYGSH